MTGEIALSGDTDVGEEVEESESGEDTRGSRTVVVKSGGDCLARRCASEFFLFVTPLLRRDCIRGRGGEVYVGEELGASPLGLGFFE